MLAPRASAKKARTLVSHDGTGNAVMWESVRRFRKGLGGLHLRNLRRMRTYVIFQAPINMVTSQELLATCTQLVNQGTTELYLAMSTPGGEVSAGLTAYNLLRALPCRVITHNTGNIDSIGNAVFLAGEERLANPHATFMFHGVGFDVISPVRFEEKNLREGLDSILADQKRIADILRERTSIDAGEAGELFREARTKDTDYALSRGIIGSIEPLQIPSGASIITMVFHR